jgi:two-component sensor histidine kinase
MRPLPPRRRAALRRVLTGVVVAGALACMRHAWRRLTLPTDADIAPFSVVIAVHSFWLIAAPVILLFAHRALASGAPRRDRVWLAVAIVVTLLGEPVWAWTVVEFAHWEAYLRSMILGRTDLNAMVVALLVGLELTELRVETAREQLARHARLLRSVAEAQLTALTLHLQPHFLFNTLQLVAECARTDAEQAARVVRALRRLLAESARHTARRLVTAADELDFIRAYLSIQLTRFEERLKVEIDMDPRAANAAVPHMLLQPIVENAIQHGISRRAQGGTISVIVRVIEDGARLLVLVRDDGPGPTADLRVRGRQGRGMNNTRARLAALYGEDFVLALRQIGRQGAETRVDIPLRELPPSSDQHLGTETPAMDPPLAHRTWLSRLALVWTFLLLLQPTGFILLRGRELGADSSALRLLFETQLREIPFYLLAFASAELVERLRRDDVSRRWLVALHAVAAFAVIWLHEAANPLINDLVGPDRALASAISLFGLRVLLIYGATVVFARAHMLTHWAAARSSVVREVNGALEAAERNVCRAQVHQGAVLSSLRALEESCADGAEAVDARVQSLAKLLRLCLDALDEPEHDVESELRIADAYCAVFGIGGIAPQLAGDEVLHAVVPPGTLATAIAAVGARPAECPQLAVSVVASRLEVAILFRASGAAGELGALQRTLNGAVRGGALVRRRMSGILTRVELSLPLSRHSDITPDQASDVLLSA